MELAEMLSSVGMCTQLSITLGKRLGKEQKVKSTVLHVLCGRELLNKNNMMNNALGLIFICLFIFVLVLQVLGSLF